MGLRLKKPIFENISQQDLVTQLECKKKARHKLPSWFLQRGIIYPEKLNVEQTSSETAGAYKSKLIQGNRLIDLTGGFGVDSFYFSKKFEEVIHCELNSELSQIAAHNFEILGAKNITTFATDGIHYLKETDKSFDWIFLDPARRDMNKKKLFLLKDYQPDVPKHLKFLFTKAENILIKTSPILDISSGLKELGFVREVHVVAIKNEVKELLWVLKKDFVGDAIIKAVNIIRDTSHSFAFYLLEEKNAILKISEPKKYLFEPNAAILKSGAFKHIGGQFGLEKLAEHTHLYTSDELVEFPGRIFEIMEVIPFNKKRLRKMNFEKANISIRNFPISVQQLRKDLKINEGGDNYLFFIRNSESEKVVIQAKKVNLSGVNPD